jgi:hypothetical protein
VIFRNAHGEIIGGVEPDLAFDTSSGGRVTIDHSIMAFPGFEQADIEVYVTLE